MFGRLGVVSHNTEGQLQCHICGVFYIHLGSHLKRHRVTPHEYREEFGLNHLQPLASYEYCESRKPIALKNQREGKFPSGDAGRVLLKEVEKIKPYCYARRLQERLTRSEMFRANNPMLNEDTRRKVSESQKRAWSKRRLATI